MVELRRLDETAIPKGTPNQSPSLGTASRATVVILARIQHRNALAIVQHSESEAL